MSASSHTTAAQRTIQKLLGGASPNGGTPDEYGPWWPVIAELHQAHQSGGTSAVQDAYAVASRAHPDLATLVASAAPTSTASPDTSVPVLPDSALIALAHRAPCATWMDDYIAFAKQASPMTPRSFHEAGALFAVSTLIARRLVLRVSTTAIFPNLYILFVARSTVYHKTTGMKHIADLFDLAGLGHMLLPHKMTPESFVQELGTNGNPMDKDEEWLKERAFAAQRGWMIDEASRLFKSMKSDTYAALLEMLLDLYECPTTMTEQTIGRGRTTIKSAYLTFFGATTPVMIGKHLASMELWMSGLWPRFSLIAPDEESAYTFFPDSMEFPPALTAQFRAMAHLFATPKAHIVDDPDGSKYVEIYDAQPAQHVQLAPGVWSAWEAYDRGLYDLVITNVVRDPLATAYGRLGKQAMKVAMILATMDAISTPDAAITVQLRHFARAVDITERWRVSLHAMWATGAQVEEVTLIDKILQLLADAGLPGMATRSIYQPLHLKSKEARELLEELAKSGHVEMFTATATNGRAMEMWRLKATNDPGRSVTV